MYKSSNWRKIEAPRTKQLSKEQIDELSDLLAKGKAGSTDCRDTLLERLTFYMVRNYDRRQYDTFWQEYKRHFLKEAHQP